MKLKIGEEIEEKIGVVGVDSGQLLITDPCYIDSHWKKEEFRDKRELKDTKTGKIYAYRVDFESYNDKLIGDKTVNELLQSGRLESIPHKKTGEFSYDGACKETLSEDNAGELGDGTGVVFSSGFGDGVYAVYATYKNYGDKKHGDDIRIKSVTVEMIIDEE
jgi:hypothetical protein